MLTDQHIEEGLSRAYVQAIASNAGINTGKQEYDYGVDGTFNRIQIVNNRRVSSGFPIDFQLKASTRWFLEDAYVVFDLEAKTYNDLVRRGSSRRAAPLILILFCLPDTPSHWLENDEERLVLRKCCYWTKIGGIETQNRSSVRINIPRNQLLTSTSLAGLLRFVEQGIDW